jgi:anti-anti-sigma factor
MLAYEPIARPDSGSPNVLDGHVAPEPEVLRMTIDSLGDVSVFRCAGRITAGDEDFLRVAVHSRSGSRAIVLDLAEVTAIDAAGLGMLVSLRGWTKASGTELKLMNLTPWVEEVFQITNLRSAFEVCSFREMMALLCRASRSARTEGQAA